MSEYEPVDLAAHLNAGIEVLEGPVRPTVGEVLLAGLPFRIGDASPDEGGSRYVAFGPGFRAEPLRIPLSRPAISVIVAHLSLGSDIPEKGGIGDHIADYAFELDDGRTVVVPIRELLEIGPLARPDLPTAGMMAWDLASAPLLAHSAELARLRPRREGPWSLAGRRMREVERGLPHGYKLWAWRAPDGARATALEVRPSQRPFLVAGVTLGLTDEEPFVQTGREPVRITLLGPEEVDRTGDLEVVVDRGVATFPWPLLSGSAEAFTAGPVKGWGEPLPTAASPAYAEVAAVPSATVGVRQEGHQLGQVKWRDVIDTGVAEDPGRIRVEWVDRTRSWVHTTVIDEATGRPIPCRIHFRSTSGIPYQPHGHHSHVNTDMPSWHMDVGGDVRLGGVSYAVIDGRCQGWLPEGDVLVEVVRGFEYEPLRKVVRIEPGQRELRLGLRRWADQRSVGWVSGDTHVHFLSTQGAHLEAAAEDLHVVNLLQAQWGHLFTNTEEFTGRTSVSDDHGTMVHVGQENRQHVLGHLGLLGLREPVMPWSSDGPDEAEIGGTLEVTLSDWADAGRRQGALITIPHFAYPNGETATLIATGRVDAVEMIWLGQYFHQEYYRYLNAGYRLPLVGGTDKMTSETPVGLYRTYVRMDRNEPVTYRSWARDLARGRTFLSGGPILRLRVEGTDIGDTMRLPPGGGTVEVEAVAESAIPFEVLQVVAAGEVVAQVSAPEGTRRLELRERVKVGGSTWVAARAGGPDYYDARRALDSFERGVFAHTSPVYVACGDGEWSMHDDATLQYLLTRVEAAHAYVRDVAPRRRLGGGGHPHGEADHLARLERPFIEARQRLLERRRSDEVASGT